MTQELSLSTFASSKQIFQEPEDLFARNMATLNALRSSSQPYAHPHQENRVVIRGNTELAFSEKIFKPNTSFWNIELGSDIDRRSEKSLQSCSAVKVELIVSPRSPIYTPIERSLHKIAQQAHVISSPNYGTLPSYHRSLVVHTPQTLTLPCRGDAMRAIQLPSMELQSMCMQNLRELQAIKVELILSPKRELFSGSDRAFIDRMATKFFQQTPPSSALQRAPSNLCSMEEVRRMTSGYNPKIFLSGMNGINTTKAEAASHQSYVQKLAGQKVHWVYNRSHGAILDLVEVFSMNYLGFSPNTAKELQVNWAAFHERNLGNPDEKLFHTCHSQGAIHTYNALRNCPSEVRDRVIVLAIAPAKIIPREMCYRSYNYASKKDIVHFGELVTAGFFNSSETGNSKYMEIMLENREQLILLDPHPGSTDIDHDFQSPTYRRVIIDHLKKYLQRGNR